MTRGRVAPLYIGCASSHRVVNAMRVGCKDQSVSVVQGTWTVRKNHTDIYCHGKVQSCLCENLPASVPDTGLVSVVSTPGKRLGAWKCRLTH
jgi:hypothetical protein